MNVSNILPRPGCSVWWVAGAAAIGLLLPATIACAIATVAYYPLGSWLPPFVFLSNAGAMILIVGMAGMLMLAGIVHSFLSWSWRPFVLVVIVIASMTVGFVPGIFGYHYVKRAGYEALALRSTPMVEAIEDFERSVGRPPSSLHDVVPTYLATLPGTGMAAYPAYEYAPEPGPCPADNTWHLKVDAGEMFKWDFFFYCPRRNYTSRGWGGVNIVVGNWAYLDE